jgi:hypothetical protein
MPFRIKDSFVIGTKTVADGSGNLSTSTALGTDIASPVAVTLSANSVLTGTSNTTGASLTIAGSKGTGTGAGGSIIFQTAAAGSTGSTQNPLATALTIAADKSITADGGIFNVNNGPTGTITLSSSSTGTLSLFNSSLTTVTAFGAGTSITLGANTVNQTINIGTGVVVTGNIKTINIGTNSATGSTTAITLGSTLGTSGVTANGTFTATGNITSNSNGVTIKNGSGIVTLAASSTAGTVTYTWPTTGQSNGYVLQTDGSGTLSWVTAGAATTATNLAGGVVGSIPYQSASNTTAFLAGNTSGTPQFVTSTGNGTVAAAPTLTSSTGTGNVVLATSPTITTSLVSGTVSFDLINTTATTINFGGAATTLNIGNAAGTVTIAGNLTVNGITTTVNSNTLTVDDKNLELGAVVAVASVTGGTITTATNTSTITGITSTAGLIPGMTVTKTSGTGAFGTATVITSVDSLTQITVTGTSAQTAGTIVFSAGAATDTTADGGGITVKGTTDKTLTYNTTNSGTWTSSENFNLVSGKTFKINGTDVLSGNTLGSGVTSSSLTQVGNIATGTWATTATSVTANGLNLYTSSAGNAQTVDTDAIVNTIASASTTTLNTFSGTTYRSCKYILQASDGTNYQAHEIMVIHNGSNTAYIAEYAVVSVGTEILKDITASYGSNTFTLSGTTTVANVTLKMYRTLMRV